MPGSGGEERDEPGSPLPPERPEWEPIRVWARENGFLVNNRGRVPAHIREAYAARPVEAPAPPDEPPSRPQP